MKQSAPAAPDDVSLDRVDRRLLYALQEDGSLSDRELGERINLSPSGCRKRRRKLEAGGVIHGYVALVDQEKVRLPEDVFVVVKLSPNGHDELAAFDEAVKHVDEVMDCYGVTGEWDYVLRVVTRDMHDHNRLCADKLSTLPGVARLESFPTLRRVVGRTCLPLRQ